MTTEIAGLVRSVEFKSGQEVKAGAVLLQLNADSDIAQLQSLQAAADCRASVLARDKQQFAAQAISQAAGRQRRGRPEEPARAGGAAGGD